MDGPEIIKPHMRAAFSGHALTRAYGKHGEPFQGFLMANPKSRAYAVVLHFTPYGMVVHGDWSIRDAPLSAHKGVGWFANPECGPDYVAGKLLRPAFVPSIAAEQIRGWLLNADDYGLDADEVAALDEAAGRLDDGLMDEADLISFFSEDDGNIQGLATDGFPGYGLDPSDVAWIHAMRTRFIDLYTEMLRAEEAK